jgi:thymidylate synthase
MLDRLLQDIQCPKDIHLGIEGWIFHRFSDIHLRRKVHDQIRSFVAKHPFKSPTLNIKFEKPSSAIEVSPFSSG